MCGDQQLAQRCFMLSTKNNRSENSLSVDKLDQRENEKRGEPVEQLISIPLREDILKRQSKLDRNYLI